jgi:hypothetical protein
MTAAGRAIRGAAIGLAIGPTLLGALHLYGGARVPASGSEAAVAYPLMAAVAAVLGALIGWLLLPAPTAEPKPGDVVRREAGLYLLNGGVVGVVYVLLRLGLLLHAQELPLWFLARYAAGMLAAITLGLGAFGLLGGWMKARDLR